MAMIKIMIVDDMPIFLEYLRGCIDWEAYGFEICAQAHDGREALELFRTYYPDVVLTDITMPYINGLELAERISIDYPETAIILITGNNEFEYARKAVKIGVCDYIVKPFEKEELILSLLKMQDNINRALELKTNLSEEEYRKKEERLRRLIFSKENQREERVFEKLANCGICFPSKNFLLFTIKIELYENIAEYENRVNWEKIIVNMLGQMLDIDGTFETFSDYENNIIAILNFESEEGMKRYKGHEFQDLIKMIKDYLELPVSVGVSDYCYGILSLKDGYYQTLQALSVNRQNEQGKVWDYKKLDITSGHTYYTWEVVDSILKCLELSDQQALDEVIVTELNRIEAYGEEELFQMVCMSFVSLLLSSVIKNGYNIEDVFGDDFSYYEKMGSVTNHVQKREYVLNCYHSLMEYDRRSKGSKSYEIAKAAKEYIETNYDDSNMTIQDISKKLFVNQTYLRKMFKEEMNMTLSEYITKYRIEMAQHLIRETDEKLFQIAERVGYSDVSYFSKCFKKYYGISPKALAK